MTGSEMRAERTPLENPRGSWHALTLVLAAAATGIGAAAWLQPEVDGADLWWHMAAGRWVLAHLAVPLHDVFTHTAYGEPWADHEWLWGVLAWRAYDLSPDLLAWINLTVAVAVFGLVALRAFDLSGSWLAACVATWFAAAASHWYIDVRPQLFTLLFSALLLVAFERRWSRWLWPPMLALWVNLHGGFIFGVGLVGLYTGVESLRSWRAGERVSRRAWILLAISLLAVGLNPWGFEMYAEPFEHLRSDTPFGALNEWRPLEWSLDPATYAGRFFWLGVMSLAGFWRARRDVTSLVLVVLTAAMTVQARRFVPLFAVVAAPVAAIGLAALFERIASQMRLPRLPEWSAPLGAATMLVVALLLWSEVRFTPHPLRRWTLVDSAPSGSVAYLAGMDDPPKHLFNSYHWGGYVSFFGRGVRPFIDGRAATLYSDELVADYHTLVEAKPGWRSLMREYQIDAVLVENPSPLAGELRREDPPWRRRGLDPRSQLLFPPTRTELVGFGGVIGECADLHLSRAFLLRLKGDLDGADAEIEQVLRADPLQIYAYGEGMMLAAERSDVAGVERFIELAMNAYPRRRDLIWTFAERAWRAMGEGARRRAALQSLRLGGPFVRSELREQLRALTP